MPIFIKDFKWCDSLQNVVVSIPLKGIPASKVDIVLTSEYLKVSFSPYIFECFFYQPISEDQSTCVADSGIMQVTATKMEQISWPQLMIDNAEDKSVTREIRDRSMVRLAERLQAAESAAKAGHRANEQLSLKEQMKLEDADRARIEAAKQAERDSAMRELEEFRLRQERLRQDAKRVFREEIAAEESAAIEQEEKGVKSFAADESSEEETRQVEQLTQSNRKQPISVESVLGVREPGRIGVSFTARVFPTPERESQKALEEEWLRKQAERRRQADATAEPGDAAADDLSDRERDPVWLRDKGNRLFASGNFLAAINAYSHAISLKSEMHSLYSNRAACHLRLGNYFKAMEDASKALELLQPPVEQNRLARVRAHCRRAAALCGLGANAKAVIELREAARLQPENAEIAEDLRRTEAAAAKDEEEHDGDGLDDVDD
ncbi:hypothetical protein BOX15_Mlig028256g4 [Macrostomum lignano]|uniref:CS domain-containing protein n=2 Tax=Macrostomum lignano TaxID=282301 RepID=A0A267DI32_9PLAT|nr:hypothetical protein BOX15_Mlig028256g5 [Macrostomum lignano]PAA49034.1 hypothetical protein BOX15_Mlig028256g4 [Macrostomum lignano]